MEEINRMLDEFEDQQITTAVQLDAYEAECRQQDSELDEPVGNCRIQRYPCKNHKKEQLDWHNILHQGARNNPL